MERSVKAADPNNATRNQQAPKIDLARNTRGVAGNCFWYSAALADNTGNYAYELQEDFHLFPALQPAMPFIDDKAPERPRKLKAIWMKDGYFLFWTAPKAKREMDRARQYVIYCFHKGEKINLEKTENILTITNKTMFKLPYQNGKEKFVYVVTSLDRLHNESKARTIKVKL